MSSDEFTLLVGGLIIGIGLVLLLVVAGGLQ
jgi:hypothetical protein